MSACTARLGAAHSTTRAAWADSSPAVAAVDAWRLKSMLRHASYCNYAVKLCCPPPPIITRACKCLMLYSLEHNSTSMHMDVTATSVAAIQVCSI